MTENLTFYTPHIPMTDPGKCITLYKDLTDDLSTPLNNIYNVLVHHCDAFDRFGPTNTQPKVRFLRAIMEVTN